MKLPYVPPNLWIPGLDSAHRAFSRDSVPQRTLWGISELKKKKQMNPDCEHIGSKVSELDGVAETITTCLLAIGT